MKASSRTTWIYILRSAVSIAVAGKVFGAWFAAHYLDPGDPGHKYKQLLLLAQLDVFHALFYAALLCFTLLMLIPRGKPEPLKDAVIMRCALWGLIVGGAPLAAALWARPDAGFSMWTLIAALYVGLNVFGMKMLQSAQRFRPGLQKAAGYALGLGDLIAPGVVWSVYARREAVGMRLWRAFPAVLLCAAPFVPWAMQPLSTVDEVRCDAEMKRVLDGRFYQVAVDTKSGRLIIVDEDRKLVMSVDPDNASVQELDLSAGGLLQAVAVDDGSRRLAAVDASTGRTFVADADSLQPVGVLPLHGASNELGQCRSYWFGERRLLLAFCAQGLYRICADGRSIQYRYATQPGDLAFDAGRDEILLVDWGQPLVALDPDTLRPVRRSNVPQMKERLALDVRGDRLLVSYPQQSRVLVVDLESFERVRWVDAFPGVRPMAVDYERGWLIMGGLAPVIEVRKLEDFSLVQRLTAPPWMRWMAIDNDRDKAYVTTGDQGLWELDLERLAGGSSWDRYDVFYALAGFASRLIGGDGESDEAWEGTVMPRAVAGEPCGEGLWYEWGSE